MGFTLKHYTLYFIVWRRHVRHFVEYGRHPRTGKRHSAPQMLGITHFHMTSSTYFVFGYRFFFVYNFPNKPLSGAERYPDIKQFTGFFFFFFTSHYRSQMVWLLLNKTIVKATNSARFCLIFQSSLKHELQRVTKQTRLPQTTPTNPMHFKHYVKDWKKEHCYLLLWS